MEKKIDKKSAEKFIKKVKSLSAEEQAGLLMMIQGAKIMTDKAVKPLRHEQSSAKNP